MKIYIDTADLNEIFEAKKLGILDGVTTNPSLIAKTGNPIDQQLKAISKTVKGPVSAEVISNYAGDMIDEAMALSKIAENIVIKIPICEEGLKAIKTLTERGINTNATLCFSPLQALCVAKSGATYVSPFVGRLDDITHDGMDLVAKIKMIYVNYSFNTQIIVASIRNPMHILYSATIGADIVTVPFKVIKQLLIHPKTTEGIKKFFEDAQNSFSNKNK